MFDIKTLHTVKKLHVTGDQKSNIRTIFYEMHGGKPDKTLPLNEQMPLEEKTPTLWKSRINKPGWTCLYYAIRWLVKPVGQHPSLQNTDARVIEKQLSTARRCLTEASLRQRGLNALLDFKARIDSFVQEAQVQIFVLDILNTVLLDTSETEKNEISQAPKDFWSAKQAQKNLTFQAFYEQRTLAHQLKGYEEAVGLFGSLETQYQIARFQLYRDVVDEETWGGIQAATFYSQLSVLNKSKILSVILNQNFLEKQKLNFIMFPRTKTENNFNTFYSFLEYYGPLLAAGFYGAQYYRQGSSSIMNMQGVVSQKFTFWPKAKAHGAEARLPVECYKASHCVILVGASQNGNARLVYFIDPNDATTLNTPPPVYAMSFDTFINYNAPDFYKGGHFISLYSAPDPL